MNTFVALNLMLCVATPMEPTMNEQLALQLIQEWKTWRNMEPHDLNKQHKLGQLAKKDEAVMKLLLKELETRDAPNKFYPGDVAKLLGLIEAQEAIPALFRFLQDQTRSDLDRFGAATGLGLIGKPALPTLAKALKSSDGFVRTQATSALGGMSDYGGRKKEPAVIPVIFEAMQNADRDVRTRAVECFECAFTAEFASPYLCKALQHNNPLVRAGAADALIEYKVNVLEAEKTLLGLLDHADAEVRFQALRGFRHDERTYGKAAVQPLRLALGDKDARIRAGAARALGNLGPAADAAVGDLLKVLKKDLNGQFEVIARGASATALGRIGPAAKEAVPALIAALYENNYLLPSVAINALGDIGPDAKAAVPILERFLEEDSDNFEVALALKRIRGK